MEIKDEINFMYISFNFIYTGRKQLFNVSTESLVGNRLIESLKSTETVKEVVNEWIPPGTMFRTDDGVVRVTHNRESNAIYLKVFGQDIKAISGGRYISFTGDSAVTLFETLSQAKESHIIKRTTFVGVGKIRLTNFSISADPNGEFFLGSILTCSELSLKSSEIKCEINIKK